MFIHLFVLWFDLLYQGTFLNEHCSHQPKWLYRLIQSRQVWSQLSENCSLIIFLILLPYALQWVWQHRSAYLLINEIALLNYLILVILYSLHCDIDLFMLEELNVSDSFAQWFVCRVREELIPVKTLSAWHSVVDTDHRLLSLGRD